MNQGAGIPLNRGAWEIRASHQRTAAQIWRAFHSAEEARLWLRSLLPPLNPLEIRRILEQLTPNQPPPVPGLNLERLVDQLSTLLANGAFVVCMLKPSAAGSGSSSSAGGGGGGSNGGDRDTRDSSYRLSAAAAIQQARERDRDRRAAASERKPDLTWIEVQLVGEDRKPIPGVRYEIRLPDGSLQEGSLDSNGVVRFDGIQPGTAQVAFPDLDREAWEPI